MRIARELGGFGDTFVAVRTSGVVGRATYDEYVTTIPSPVCRWSSLAGPDSDELASVQRELLRHRGEKVFEP